MTVSSKLLFGFRSTSSRRSSDQHPASSVTLTHGRTRHRHGHGSRFNHRDDSNPPPPPPSRIARLEHESVRLERRSNDELEASNRSTGVAIDVVSRAKLIRNDRLPDAVLQARARLLERLRGLSLLENSSSTDDFGAVETETPRDLIESNMPHIESTPSHSKKRPPRLSWEVLCSQHRQVFRNIEGSADEQESSECYICLEPFCEGDVLIRLHCQHRFHPSCLQPWIQICADCPCCRANVC